MFLNSLSVSCQLFWPVTTLTAHIHVYAAPLASYRNLTILFLFEIPSICTRTHTQTHTHSILISCFAQIFTDVLLSFVRTFQQSHTGMSHSPWLPSWSRVVTELPTEVEGYSHSCNCFFLFFFHLRNSTPVYFLIFLLRTLSRNILYTLTFTTATFYVKQFPLYVIQLPQDPHN